MARRLAPKRLVADSIRAGRSRSGRLAELLGPGLLPAAQGGRKRVRRAWPVLPAERLLRVPFAITADGAPLELDLKESAEGGHGPHGLVVGAVGSGKSELLRTLVSGLIATHGPDDVELAFADFKGGLTFSLLQEVPHCSGMITNLAEDLTLVDRMKAALMGELERRQQLLRAAGSDVQKIRQYRALREAHPDLPPMPYLVVVVDEFGELLEARPDVLDVLLLHRPHRSQPRRAPGAREPAPRERSHPRPRQLSRVPDLPAHIHPGGQRLGARVARRGRPASPSRGTATCGPGRGSSGSSRRPCRGRLPVRRPPPAAAVRRSPGASSADSRRHSAPTTRRTTATSRCSSGRPAPPGKTAAGRRCGYRRCPGPAAALR